MVAGTERHRRRSTGLAGGSGSNFLSSHRNSMLSIGLCVTELTLWTNAFGQDISKDNRAEPERVKELRRVGMFFC